MSKLLPLITATTLALGVSISPAATQEDTHQPKADIGYVKLDNDITVRRMVVRNPKSKGVVLLLHGFPETLHTWEATVSFLADDFEVHSFYWPRLWPVLTAIDGQIFLRAPRLRARAEGIYRQGRPRSIDTHHICDRHWGSAGALGGN